MASCGGEEEKYQEKNYKADVKYAPNHNILICRLRYQILKI